VSTALTTRRALNASISEIVGKTRKDLTIDFSEHDNGSVPDEYVKFSGDSVWIDFEEYYQNNINRFKYTKRLSVFAQFHDLAYLAKYPNVRVLWIHGSRIPLGFPDMHNMLDLEEIHINGQSKPSSYEKLDTASNLRNLYIGDWSIPTPVKVKSFEVILNCKSLRKLYLSHFQILEGSVRDLVSLQSLKELTLPQNISVEDLAYLSVKMPSVSSNELKAYQECDSLQGNVKVNGKRMPYLDKDKDKLKLQKFEADFEKLKKGFAGQ
jgi:hypothetical protein